MKYKSEKIQIVVDGIAMCLKEEQKEPAAFPNIQRPVKYLIPKEGLGSVDRKKKWNVSKIPRS